MAEIILFYTLALVAVAAALFMITRVNPLMSALMLVISFLATAGIFAMLGSAFLAVLQVLLYAGAIMVLFVFVIMLMHIDESELKMRVISFGKILGAAAAVYLAIVLGIAAWRPPFIGGPQIGNTFVSPATLGKELLTRYVLPFEILSVLLLVAMVGAIVMAKKKI